MSISNTGSQLSTDCASLSPQRRQAIGMALLSQAGQPIQNPRGPISPLSVLAKALQGYNATKMLQGRPEPAQSAQSAPAGRGAGDAGDGQEVAFNDGGDLGDPPGA